MHFFNPKEPRKDGGGISLYDLLDHKRDYDDLNDHYEDGRTFKKFAPAALSLCMLFGCIAAALGAISLMSSLTGASTAEAATTAELRSEANETQSLINQTNSQISALEDERDEILADAENLEGDVAELLLEQAILEADAQAGLEALEEAEAAYEAAVEAEELQYELMKQRIQYIYESGDLDYLTAFLKSGGNYTSFQDNVDSTEALLMYDAELMEEYKAAVEEADAAQEEAEDALSDYTSLQGELEESVAALETELAEVYEEDKNYEEEIVGLKEQVSAYAARLTEINAELSELEPATTVTASGSGTGTEIANYALQFVGNPYVYGGTSLTNGTDCSGFVMSVYAAFGISLPHSSSGIRSYGTEVSYADAQPGDIVCYSGHVGIYIGDGQIVHASTSATGIKVSSATYRTIVSVRRLV